MSSPNPKPLFREPHPRGANVGSRNTRVPHVARLHRGQRGRTHSHPLHRDRRSRHPPTLAPTHPRRLHHRVRPLPHHATPVGRSPLPPPTQRIPSRTRPHSSSPPPTRPTSTNSAPAPTSKPSTKPPPKPTGSSTPPARKTPVPAQLELADFYQRRLEIPQAIAVLKQVAAAPSPASETYVDPTQQRSWRAFDRIFTLIHDQGLPAFSLHRSLQRRHRPLSRSTRRLRRVLPVRTQPKRLRRRRIPHRPLPHGSSPKTPSSRSEPRPCSNSAAATSTPPSPSTTRPSSPCGRPNSSSPTSRCSTKPTASAPSSPKPAPSSPPIPTAPQRSTPLLASSITTSKPVACKPRNKPSTPSASPAKPATAPGRPKTSPPSQPSQDTRNYAEAARYNFALASLDPAAKLPSGEPAAQAGLSGLIHILLEAPDQPLALGAQNLTLYRDIATLEQGPGYWNGILSLWLNGTRPDVRIQDRDRQGPDLLPSRQSRRAPRHARPALPFRPRARRAPRRAHLHATRYMANPPLVIAAGKELPLAFPSARTSASTSPA